MQLMLCIVGPLQRSKLLIVLYHLPASLCSCFSLPFCIPSLIATPLIAFELPTTYLRGCRVTWYSEYGACVNSPPA
ncbi:hypothetical protein BZA70DRAFT_279310 [Myxozyma melibiosi]|uniref:Secreted protein n=1 Tax=Myxozyma melibiosi TaxID=54550 RepID=A0ABR1F5V1_9ASCO